MAPGQIVVAIVIAVLVFGILGGLADSYRAKKCRREGHSWMPYGYCARCDAPYSPPMSMLKCSECDWISALYWKDNGQMQAMWGFKIHNKYDHDDKAEAIERGV